MIASFRLLVMKIKCFCKRNIVIEGNNKINYVTLTKLEISINITMIPY